MREGYLNSNKIHEYPKVVVVFTRENQMPFFEKFNGYDEEVNEEFLFSLKHHSKIHATISFRGLAIELTSEFISRITSLPLGLPWRKGGKPLGEVAKKTFFQPNEHPDKNGTRMKSIPYPWGEVSYKIMKSISCARRYNIVCGYHFKMLHEL